MVGVVVADDHPMYRFGLTAVLNQAATRLLTPGGLNTSDVERLLRQLHALVEAGNTVITVEHDMRMIAASVSLPAAKEISRERS